MKKIKTILIISLAINIIAICFAARRVYYMRIDSANTKPPSFYIANRAKLYSYLPINPNDIIFIGDSQIELFNTQELLPQYPIKNRGIGGDNIKNMLSRIGDAVKGKPQKIFIEIGTNDRGNISANQYKNYLNQILDSIKKKSPSTKIYLQSVLPVTLSGYDTIKDFNKVLQDASLRYNAQYVDLYNTMSENGHLNKIYDAGDGLHINGQGYLLWSQLLKPYL